MTMHMATIDMILGLVHTLRFNSPWIDPHKLFGDIARVPGVDEAFPTVGAFDGVVLVKANTFEEAIAVIERVRGMHGVASVETVALPKEPTPPPAAR